VQYILLFGLMIWVAAFDGRAGQRRAGRWYLPAWFLGTMLLIFSIVVLEMDDRGVFDDAKCETRR
jgi:heme/copper-type cytochrome/quinol oxidase subunit 1